MKTCSLCKQIKPLDEFNKNKRLSQGAGQWCRDCIKTKNSTPHYRAKNEEWKKRNPKKMILIGARIGARQRGLAFDITEDDFDIPAHCPVLGIQLTERRSGKRDCGTPTIDRIINDLGYVKGNIIVISWRANRIKSDATLVELRAITSFYESFNA